MKYSSNSDLIETSNRRGSEECRESEWVEAGGPTGVAVQRGVGSGGTFRAGGPAVQRRGGTAERRERES